MKCKVCEKQSEKIFNSTVLNKYAVNYFHCTHCGFLQTDEPYWLNEAYNSAINISDTGLINRNIYYSKVVSVLTYFLFDKHAKFVDYAGGYGLFTRLLRDVGFDFYWQDLHCNNLLSRGFEYDPELHKDIELLTAFEVFEHLVNPIEEIKKMVDISGNIVFSTLLLPIQTPKPGEWWYYGLEHGQHISFYSHKTLNFIANKFGLYFYSYRNVHIFTKNKINFSIFKLLILLTKLGLFFYVRKNLKSKTWDDHLLFSKNKL